MVVAEKVRIGNFMRMYPTGTHFYHEDPQPADVNIADIAHHLSMICRFGGGVRKHFSVAEHSMNVARLLYEKTENRWMALIGLMHDAPEAYLSDIVRPAKAAPQLKGYLFMEQMIWLAIARKFSLPVHLPEEVHKADVAAYYAERDTLLGWDMEDVDMQTRDPEWTMPKGWVQARDPATNEEMFLADFKLYSA